METVFGREVDPQDFLGPLYGVDRVPAGDEDLLLYWSTPAARDIANFVWDTSVPEVTDRWPVMEPQTLRDAMVMVIGSEDVTGFLYSLDELNRALDAGTPLLIPVEEELCDHCGQFCRDKWCGLRGDDETAVIEGVVADE